MAFLTFSIRLITLFSYALKVQSQVTASISPQEDYNAPVDPERSLRFDCEATERVVQWLVNGLFANDAEVVNKSVTTTFPTEQSGGLFLSTLFVPARQENNNTTIQCRTTDLDSNPVVTEYSKSIILGIQGLLGPPPNLSLTASGDQLTRTLTWDAPETLNLTDIEPDIESYQVCYNLSSDDLTCVNVSSSERRVFIFPNVCVPLIFTVTAFNVVGQGNANQIVHSGRTAQDKSISVAHQVSFIQPGNDPTVTLSLIQGSCVPIFEVQIALNASRSNTTSHGPEILEMIETGGTIEQSLTIDSDLLVNEIYYATITVNSKGYGHASDTIEFSTYDVQAVNISVLLEELELSCTFANGSQARSCILTVCEVDKGAIDEESCVNITINRNSEAFVNSTTQKIDQPGEHCIKEVIEVESDGNLTVVRLIAPESPVPTTTKAATQVSTVTGGLSPNGDGTNAGGIAAGVIVGVALMAVITTIIIIGLVLWRKKKVNKISREKSSRHLLGDSETDGGKVDTLNNKRESKTEATDPCYETVPNKPTGVTTTTASNDQQEGVPPQNGDIQKDIIKSDSPTFPLYTEVMGKGTPQLKQREDKPQEDKPDPPPKKLSVKEVRELNLASEEDVPDVPAQNLTEEDIRNLNLSVRQEPVEVHTSQVQQVPGPIAAAGGDPLYAELEHKKSKPSVTVPDMTEVQYSQIKTDEIPPVLPQKKKSRKNKEQSSPVIQRSETETAGEPTVQTEKDITPTNIESGESQSQDQLDNVV